MLIGKKYLFFYNRNLIMVSRSCNSNIIGENNSSFITLNLRNVDFANSRPQIYNFVHQFIELLAVVFYFALFKQQVSEKFLKNKIRIQTFLSRLRIFPVYLKNNIRSLKFYFFRALILKALWKTLLFKADYWYSITSLKGRL